MVIKIALSGYDKTGKLWCWVYEYSKDESLGRHKFFNSFVQDCKVDFSERFGVNIDNITVTRHIYPNVC